MFWCSAQSLIRKDYGMGVISASDEAGARAFAAGDPAMKASVGFKV
jgi:hypothetical protein